MSGGSFCRRFIVPTYILPFFFLFNFYLFIGCAGPSLLHRLFSSRGEQRCSLVSELRLSSCDSQDSRSSARKIFPDQGWNPCLWQWQVESLPPSHQGSLSCLLIGDAFWTGSLAIGQNGHRKSCERPVWSSCSSRVLWGRALACRELNVSPWHVAPLQSPFCFMRCSCVFHSVRVVC